MHSRTSIKAEWCGWKTTHSSPAFPVVREPPTNQSIHALLRRNRWLARGRIPLGDDV